MRVLAADIGGTNARLAMVELDGAVARITAECSVPSREVQALGVLLTSFVASAGAPPERACLGIAGPVIEGRISGTNLPWSVSEAELSEALDLPGVRLINDFAAVGYGIPLLRDPDFLVLQTGTPDPAGALGLIGAGTGLGQGFVVRTGGAVVVQPSEGGHATFTAETSREWELVGFLRARYGHVSQERVISGPGLVDLYEFVGGLVARREAAAAGLDPAAEITRRALAGEDPRAVEAVGLFLEAYGAAAGNLALTVLATGGVYLAGGVTRHLAAVLADGRFLAAFRRKGRLSGLLERIPVRAILNPDVGLLGAAAVAAAE